MDKTSFGEEVYSVVASIPPGRVLTYGFVIPDDAPFSNLTDPADPFRWLQ